MRKAKNFTPVLSLVFLAAASAASAEDASAPSLDIVAYDLSLDLDLKHQGFEIAANRMQGEARITIANSGPEGVSRIPVVLNRLRRAWKKG